MAALALLAPGGPAQVPPESAPNVLILTMDTLRPDALGWVAGRNSTPALDALAGEGFRFRAAVAPLWPAYDALEGAEGTWSTRAVSGWYRSKDEAANAYAVMVSRNRPALEKARTGLGSAADAVSGPTRAQSATLASADQALASLREPA